MRRNGWYGERHRHYLAAKGIKTTHSQKYFMFKTEESNTPSDNPGIFGWRHKNNTIKTNHRLETVNRKKRVWMDKIEQGVSEGKYSHKLPDEFLEDVVKPLEEQYVNGQITREQFDQEWESKGQFKIDQYAKTASAFGWAKPQNQKDQKIEETPNVSAFSWAKNQQAKPQEGSQW